MEKKTTSPEISTWKKTQVQKPGRFLTCKVKINTSPETRKVPDLQSQNKHNSRNREGFSNLNLEKTQVQKPGRFLKSQLGKKTQVQKPGRFLNPGTRKVPGKLHQRFFYKSSQKHGRFPTSEKAAGTRKVPDLFGKISGPGTRKVPDLFGKKKSGGPRAEERALCSPRQLPLAWPRAFGQLV